MDLWRSSFWALAVLLASSCGQRREPQETARKQDAAPLPDSTAALLRPDSLPEGPTKALVLERNVKIRDYFAFIDSIVKIFTAGRENGFTARLKQQCWREL